MRKVSLILAVLLFTVTIPAEAVVTIICEQVDPGGDEVRVRYVVSGEPNKVRAFALDITVDNGVISAVDANVATYDPNYNVYPGSIVIVDGEVNNPGTAVADPCDHPDTQPGIGSIGITVEMGALYDPPDDANGPPLNGDLLIFTNTVASGNTIVTITENDSRGGVVLTDPNADPVVVSAGCEIAREPIKCYHECLPDYDEWVAVGEPNCWCYDRQCRGDTDDFAEYIKGQGYYYVHFSDLDLLVASWTVLEPPDGPGIGSVTDGICADFAHNQEFIKGQGYYRVHFTDLDILVAGWTVLEPPDGPGIPPDCLDCPD